MVNEGKKQRSRVINIHEPCPFCGSMRDMPKLYLVDDHIYVNQCMECGQVFAVINGQVYQKEDS